MKKYLYVAGTIALALSMSGLPALALAEDNGGDEGGAASARTEVQARSGDVRASTSIRAGEEESEDRVADEDQNEQEIDIELEDDEDLAFSLDDLKQKIEDRKHELDDEEASTTPRNQNIMKNANPVRLAVHALLASENLLGGIGEQVSEIAKHMNDSVATTTNAEAKIQSRGFLARLLFGGDSASAQVIAQEVAQNQARIDELTALLGQANVPADIQATLTAQLAALQDAQTRLQDLAQKEQKAWGLFSWRF